MDSQKKILSKSEVVRLSKLMAERNICSRREADRYIHDGMVYVDGVIIKELGTKVDPNCRITLSGDALREQKSLVSVVLNKPVGFVSSQPEDGYEPAIKLLTSENEWHKSESSDHKKKDKVRSPIELSGLAVTGRLDIDSQGLLIFTQDGRLAKKIIGENSAIEKEYLVRVEGKLSPSELAKLKHGLFLDGKPLKPAQVEWINKDQLKFILQEGKKRQIRRMCELVGLKVIGLKRVRVGNLVLGNLPEGKWRYLEKEEI